MSYLTGQLSFTLRHQQLRGIKLPLYLNTLFGRCKRRYLLSAMWCTCAQDKVNISVAIIPMAQDFGWSPTVAGLVQSSFFYGARHGLHAATCVVQLAR